MAVSYSKSALTLLEHSWTFLEHFFAYPYLQNMESFWNGCLWQQKTQPHVLWVLPCPPDLNKVSCGVSSVLPACLFSLSAGNYNETIITALASLGVCSSLQINWKNRSPPEIAYTVLGKDQIGAANCHCGLHWGSGGLKQKIVGCFGWMDVICSSVFLHCCMLRWLKVQWPGRSQGLSTKVLVNTVNNLFLLSIVQVSVFWPVLLSILKITILG